MADVPASDIHFRKEGLISGSARFKIYQIDKDGTGVTVPITPGTGFTYCVGSELGYTLSSGVFTLKQAAGTDGDLYEVMFISS